MEKQMLRLLMAACVVAIVLATASNTNNDTQDQSTRGLNATNLAPYTIPCVRGQNLPSGCSPRMVACGTTPVGSTPVIGPNQNTWCVNKRIYFGEIYIVQWYDADRSCWEVKMAVGECWGSQPGSGSDYTCQGKCGAGCGNVNCGAWARDCLRHDVCSWFHSSSGGNNDPHCGEAFRLATDDFLTNCLCTATEGSDTTVCQRWG